MSDELYTESQVNELLENQKIQLRLDGIESALKGLSNGLSDHIAMEKKETEQVMEALEENANERRRCEKEIKGKIIALDADHYSTFVKKSDLKLYVIIIITAVTMTTGFVTWLGTQHTKAEQAVVTTELLEKIKLIIGK